MDIHASTSKPFDGTRQNKTPTPRVIVVSDDLSPPDFSLAFDDAKNGVQKLFLELVRSVVVLQRKVEELSEVGREYSPPFHYLTPDRCGMTAISSKPDPEVVRENCKGLLAERGIINPELTAGEQETEALLARSKKASERHREVQEQVKRALAHREQQQTSFCLYSIFAGTMCLLGMAAKNCFSKT